MKKMLKLATVFAICYAVPLLTITGCKKKESYKPQVVEQQSGVIQTSTGNPYYKHPDGFPDAIVTCMDGYKFIVSQDNIVQVINSNGQGTTCN